MERWIYLLIGFIIGILLGGVAIYASSWGAQPYMGMPGMNMPQNGHGGPHGGMGMHGMGGMHGGWMESHEDMESMMQRCMAMMGEHQ